MTPEIQLIPTDAITFRIARDRTALDKDDYDELRLSLLTHGLRQPIEVYELPDPDADEQAQGKRYGLIAGYRRLYAFRDLNETVAPGKFAEIPALIRPFSTVAEAMRQMVEENELHAAVSPWEKGYLLAEAVTAGIFDSTDAAITGLFPGANATKRSRLRTYARVYDELQDTLKLPEGLSTRHMLRLGNAVREGWGEVIRQHLGDIQTESPDEQWKVIEPLLIEFERDLAAATPAITIHPRRPIRFSVVKRGLRIRREMTKHGYTLHFSGHEATSGFMDDLIEQIEAWYQHHN